MQPNTAETLTKDQQKSQARGPEKTRTRRILADLWAGRFFGFSALLPFLLTIGVAGVLLFRSWPILSTRPLTDLLLGMVWKPSSNAFGFLPFIAGSFIVTLVSLILTMPICLLSAIYLSEYALPAVKTIARPVLDILAGIPSVIYGMWGILVIVPAVEQMRKSDLLSGLFFASKNPTGYSVLAAGIVLAVMVAPFVINLVFEILQTVPNGLKEASLAVGSTHWQTIHKVILPSVRSGIIAAVVFGTSRALGETMAVMMVVGNVAKVPGSIFDAAYPLPALIANSYGEMLSIPLYDSALMAAALILLVVILIFNLAAQLVLRRYALWETVTS
jgi:phosphate transport system permease protein